MTKKAVLKPLLFCSLLLGTVFVSRADEQTNGCDPAWAPFWKTSCTYIDYDSNGNLTVYRTTCRHFIVTTKCWTEPLPME